MDPNLSYFTYCPPKSNSHGHTVRDNNVRRATQKVIDSFVDCFNATSDNRLELVLYYDKDHELEIAHRTREKLTEYLGPLKGKWDNPGFAHMNNYFSWRCENINILDFLAYTETLKNNDFLPLHKYWISSFYHYGKSPDPNGHIMCSIQQGRLFVMLNLIIPYPINDDRCYELIYKFHKSLPFKLNGNHFRRLGQGKRGYNRWKLDEETQNQLNECLIKSKKK